MEYLLTSRSEIGIIQKSSLRCSGNVIYSFCNFGSSDFIFQQLHGVMAVRSVPSALPFKTCDVFGNPLKPFNFLPIQTRNFQTKTLVAKRRANTRTESAKIRNRRTLKKNGCVCLESMLFLGDHFKYIRGSDIMRKEFNGTRTKPRLSIFCSTKQLYAMLVDDQSKKCLFYGSTLQKPLRGDPPRSTIEAAECLGEELIKACMDLKINEISSYDRNGFAGGERMQAFEIAISRHGFLPR
ncbi:50S ribosomal protein L18 [Populus alba x Populus x berolinensis]|nr:50S ribosomal protein L18 [Populus alba x Populus x berolinensis]